MSVTTRIKVQINLALRPINLRLDTLTAEAAGSKRIEALYAEGHFERPVFPLLPGMSDFSFESITNLGATYGAELLALMGGQANPDGYDPKNDFYSSPDAELLYLMVRSLKPKRVVEVGSGNSTRIVRQAIQDGQLSVEHTAIDPAPRADIKTLVDRMLLSRLEDIDVDAVLGSLGENDILFIDSSHEVRIGNDVAQLFCSVLPSLAPRVVVHVHDIFLPFDYQEPYPREYPGWGEQYLLQTFLQHGNHELIWPGFYLQTMRAEEYKALRFLGAGRASSFWFKVGG